MKRTRVFCFRSSRIPYTPDTCTPSWFWVGSSRPHWSALEAALRVRVHLRFAQILVEVLTLATALCGALFCHNYFVVVLQRLPGGCDVFGDGVDVVESHSARGANEFDDEGVDPPSECFDMDAKDSDGQDMLVFVDQFFLYFFRL